MPRICSVNSSKNSSPIAAHAVFLTHVFPSSASASDSISPPDAITSAKRISAFMPFPSKTQARSQEATSKRRQARKAAAHAAYRRVRAKVRHTICPTAVHMPLTRCERRKRLHACADFAKIVCGCHRRCVVAVHDAIRAVEHKLHRRIPAQTDVGQRRIVVDALQYFCNLLRQQLAPFFLPMLHARPSRSHTMHGCVCI